MATNPFLEQPNGLVVLSRVIAEAPLTDSSREARDALGLSSQFEISFDHSQPIVTVSVEGGSPVDVIETRDWVVAVIESELLTVQEQLGAPTTQTASAHTFMAEASAIRIVGDSARAKIGVIAAGLILSAVWAAAVQRRHQSSRAGYEKSVR
ncbi:hypothetical protein [Tessaracoccus rhinocerotis]|nr:hypothetical protein [Tessaracoccus rhinocerotis]